MKIGIIGAKNIIHLSMISLYTRIFDKYNFEYEIIYFDREKREEKYYNTTLHPISLNLNAQNDFLSRLKNKIKFEKAKKELIRCLEQNKYDFLVLWGDEVAAVLSKYVCAKFSKRYSVNIRDLWNMEDKKHSELVFNAILSSSFSTVSSDGFLAHLPKSKYIFVHSANKNLLSDDFVNVRHKDRCIIITSIGTFRNDLYNFQIVKAFASDKRYILKYIGSGCDRVKMFVEKNNITNVSCYDYFRTEDTIKLLNDTSILNCAYGADTIAEKTKIPIRFYYALYLRIPVLTTEGTWLSKLAHEIGIGIDIPADGDMDNIPEIVYEKYKLLNLDDNGKIQDYINEVESSHRRLEQEVCNCLEEEKRRFLK